MARPRAVKRRFEGPISMSLLLCEKHATERDGKTRVNAASQILLHVRVFNRMAFTYSFHGRRTYCSNWAEIA
jgi:hypothetical protein